MYHNVTWILIFSTKGIPEIGLPALDPYFAEKERFVYETGDIKADITITNAYTYGLAKAQFLAVRPQYSENFFKLEFDTALPKMFIEGNYKADGSMGAVHLSGDGIQINYF